MSIKRRNFTVESDSPQHYLRNAANMPIFEDTSELFNRSSRHFSLEQHSLSEKFGPASTPPSSSALKALQGYGSTFSTDMLSSAKQKYDIEKQGRNMNTFGNLNLNSVDEEDEFLYGDSNSLPEEPKSVLSNSESGINRNNSGWSDEDDNYGESIISQTNLKSNVKNNPVVVRSEKKMPRVSHKTLVEKSSSTGVGRMFSEKKKSNSPEAIHSTHSSVKTIKDSNMSPYFKSINEVEKNVPNSTYLPEVSTTGTKSKYHVAAQILKKQTEKHDLRNKLKSLNNNREFYNLDHSVSKRQEHPSIELSNKPTGKRTVVLPKTLHTSEERELSSNIRTSSLVENQRHVPKYFQPKELDDNKHYLKDSSRNNDDSSREHLHDLRSSFKSSKNIPPGRYCSPSFESARVHNQRNSHSPSPRIHSRHRSPYTSRHRSPDYKYKYRSPPHGLRHKSPLDDITKPSYEYGSKHTIVRDKPRHYSRSPNRRSREQSPEYYKRRNRSQSRPHEKSKSPVYHRSRDHSPRTKYLKTAEDKKKKTLQEHSISSKRQYSKDVRKSRGSSSSSFCSLSFESHSLSSDSLSEGSSHEKKDSKKSEKSSFKGGKKIKLDSPEKEKVLDKLAIKSADVIPSKCEENFVDTTQSNALNQNSENQDDSDPLKKLSAEDKEIYNAVSNVFDRADFFNAFINAQQNEMDYAENSVTASKIEDSALLPNASMPFPNENVSNTLDMSNQPMPEIPFSQFFPFNPAMHPMPAPYPPVNNYPPLIPPSILPSHVSASSYYPPYIMPEMNYPLPIEPKQVHKKRPATLRSIPVSDNLDIVPEVINIQPSLAKSEPNSSDSSPGKLRIESLEKIKPKTQLTALKESKVQENTSLIESYKKLKAERRFAQAKLKSVSDDNEEMQKMIKEAWDDKSNMDANDKILYGKCQGILNLSTETMRHYIREAKHFDEELRKVKEKLPKELVEETKLSAEDCVTETHIPSVTYILFDSGKHVCSFCNRIFINLIKMLEHLHSPIHKQNASSENDWKKDFRSKPCEEKIVDRKAALHPVSGIEFMKPTSGFFCTLCKEHSIDHIDAELHLKSSDHHVKYKTHTKDNPLYESKCTVKRYIGQSVAIKAIKEKRRKEAEEKEEQLAKRRKQEEAADKKVKEKIKDQQSKEKNVDELEEMKADNLTSNNQKLSGIKLTLSGDKVKTDNTIKEKPVQKVVYIGRAPNYKAAAKHSSRPLPWYKREAQPDSNKSTSNADIVKKLKEKIASKSFAATASSIDVEKETDEKISVPLYEVPLHMEHSVNTIKHATETNSALRSGIPTANKSLSSSVTKEQIPSKVALSSNMSCSLEDVNKLSGKLSAAMKKHPKEDTQAYTCLTEKESKNLSDNNVKNKEFYGPVYKATEISEPKSLSSENYDKTKVKSVLKVKTSSTSSGPNGTKSSKITDVSFLTKKNSIKSHESKTHTQSIDPAVKNILYRTTAEIPKIAEFSHQSPMSKSGNEPTPKDMSSPCKNISLSNIQLPEVPGVPQQPPIPKGDINDPTPMDISPIKDFQMTFPDVSQPPPLIKETINEPTVIGFLDTSQPPPLHPTPIDNPPIGDFQIGFPDVSLPPPSILRDTLNKPIRNFQNVPPKPRKFTEEEKDFMILGINKNDFMPLVIPVPPPLSFLHHSSYVRNVACTESPAFSPPNNGPCVNNVQVSSTGTIEVIQNSTVFSSPSFRKQTLKSNKSNLITISPDEKAFATVSKNLKSEKALSNAEPKIVQNIIPISKNEKDKLPKSDTKRLTSAEFESSMKSEVECLPVTVKQTLTTEGVDFSVNIEKPQMKHDVLNKSCLEQLTLLKVQNSIKSECDKNKHESTESDQIKPEFTTDQIKPRSELSDLDVAAKKIEMEKYMKCEYENIKDKEKLQELEIKDIVAAMSERSPEQKAEETLITMECVKTKNTDFGSQTKKSQEAEVKNLTLITPENKLSDERTNEMDESNEDICQNSDVGRLGSLEVEKNMVTDSEVAENKVKGVLLDSEIVDFTCTSLDCVEPEKNSVMEVASATSKMSLTSEIPQGVIKKDENCPLITLEKAKIFDSFCKIKVIDNIELVASEDPASASVASEKIKGDKLLNSNIEQLVSCKVESIISECGESNAMDESNSNKMEKACRNTLQKSDTRYLGSLEVEKNIISDCEVINNEVKGILLDSEMEDLTCTSQNSVESEKESVMDTSPPTSEITTSSEKQIPLFEGEMKKDDNITLVVSEGPAASKYIATGKTEGDNSLKLNIEPFSSCELENKISECDEAKAKFNGSEINNSLLVSQNSIESVTKSNMELADAVLKDSISSKKYTSSENESKTEVVEFEEQSLMPKCIDFSSEIKEPEKKEISVPVASENYATSKSSAIAIEIEIKSEKLVSLKTKNNLSSECFAIIKKDTSENAPILKCDVEKKIDESMKAELEKSPLLSFVNSQGLEYSVDKSTVYKPKSSMSLQVEDQCIKDNHVDESNLIFMKQHDAVSEKRTSSNFSNSNECSFDSEKVISIDNYVELPMLQECQKERYVVKHEICSKENTSSINKVSSNDINVSSQSVITLETMPILTSVNTSKSSDVIEHEQSSSVQQFDPPILKSESLKSTEEVYKKLLINNENHTIQQTACVRAVESATSNINTEQSSEQPSKCSTIYPLKPEPVLPADVVESTLEPLESSTSKIQVSLISENKIDEKTSTEILSSSQESLPKDCSFDSLDSLHKSVLQLFKISNSNRNTVTEQDSSTQKSVDGKDEKFIDIPKTVSKLDPVCKSSSSECCDIYSPKTSEQQESSSKIDACEIFQSEEMTEIAGANTNMPVMQSEKMSETDGYSADMPVVRFVERAETDMPNTDAPVWEPYQMDCSSILETDRADSGSLEAADSTSWTICLKSQKEENNEMDFFLSLISDEKDVIKVSKKGGDGSDTDEYNNE